MHKCVCNSCWWTIMYKLGSDWINLIQYPLLHLFYFTVCILCQSYEWPELDMRACLQYRNNQRLMCTNKIKCLWLFFVCCHSEHSIQAPLFGVFYSSEPRVSVPRDDSTHISYSGTIRVVSKTGCKNYLHQSLILRLWCIFEVKKNSLVTSKEN